jgi:hypothetical protein
MPRIQRWNALRQVLQAVDKVASGAAQVAGLGMKGEQFMDIQVRAMEQCRGYVRDNPVMASASP